MSVCKLNHNGAEVLFCEHSSFTALKTMGNLHTEEQIIWHDPKQHEEFIHSNILIDSWHDPRARHNRKRHRALNRKKVQYIGLVGAKRILFFAYNKFIGSKLH